VPRRTGGWLGEACVVVEGAVARHCTRGTWTMHRSAPTPNPQSPQDLYDALGDATAGFVGPVQCAHVATASPLSPPGGGGSSGNSGGGSGGVTVLSSSDISVGGVDVLPAIVESAEGPGSSSLTATPPVSTPPSAKSPAQTAGAGTSAVQASPPTSSAHAGGHGVSASWLADHEDPFSTHGVLAVVSITRLGAA